MLVLKKPLSSCDRTSPPTLTYPETRYLLTVTAHSMITDRNREGASGDAHEAFHHGFEQPTSLEVSLVAVFLFFEHQRALALALIKKETADSEPASREGTRNGRASPGC